MDDLDAILGDQSHISMVAASPVDFSSMFGVRPALNSPYIFLYDFIGT